MSGRYATVDHVPLLARAACALALLVCLIATVPAADTAPAGRDGGPVVTRLVQLLGDAERQLDDALRNRAASAVDGLLAENFEQRSAPAPDAPTPRAEWLAAYVADTPAPVDREQLAARELGDVVVLSFLERGPSRVRFVVDVWQRLDADEDRWQLRARYVDR